MTDVCMLVGEKKPTTHHFPWKFPLDDHVQMHKDRLSKDFMCNCLFLCFNGFLQQKCKKILHLWSDNIRYKVSLFQIDIYLVNWLSLGHIFRKDWSERKYPNVLDMYSTSSVVLAFEFQIGDSSFFLSFKFQMQSKS